MAKAKENTENVSKAKEGTENTPTTPKKKTSAKNVNYLVYAGPFKDKKKALKQAAVCKKIIAESILKMQGNDYILFIKQMNNKGQANDLKKELIQIGIEANVLAVK